MGYGANQKSCYGAALGLGADIVIMVHPDYQYTPKLIPSMAYLIANDVYEVVLGSRILGKGALKGGMPLYKYISNRFLTLIQNFIIGQNFLNTIPGTGPFQEKFSKALITRQIRMILFLITRCYLRFFFMDSK